MLAKAAKQKPISFKLAVGTDLQKYLASLIKLRLKASESD